MSVRVLKLSSCFRSFLIFLSETLLCLDLEVRLLLLNS